MKFVKIFACLALFLQLGFGAEFKIDNLPKNYYKYDKEFKKASKEYNIPLVLLKSIALTENSKMTPQTTGYNTNKTTDYGLMQINSIWLKAFNLSEDDIVDPQTNINIAAKILRDIINKHGYSWDSVGRYHSATKDKKAKWTKKVKKSMSAILKMDKTIGAPQLAKDALAVAADNARRKVVMIDIQEYKAN
ncbi:lytic transglycosylase domain-containing protein [Campylobacter sp. MOP51]|uniref:lytic transglycosylase domain-containing protein n=1 Tax=Campylobacter canis TaxID=3378588 RepID=UPI003C442EBE